MDFLARIADRKIQEAMERGEFDQLALKGKPIELSSSPFVPEELRLAYTVLKNAGFLPPEMELQKEIRSLKDLLRAVESADDDVKIRLTRRINARVLKLNLMLKRSLASEEAQV